MIKLLHLSDNHGKLEKLQGRHDIVVCSGDFLPTFVHAWNGERKQEAAAQLLWLQEKAEEIKNWLRGAPFLFIEGNHGFLNPDLIEQQLRYYGINAINLTDKIVTYQGVNFYGFPYVPTINGVWNYECDLEEMQEKVDIMCEKLNETYVDVIVSHGPLSGILDSGFGSNILLDGIINKISKDLRPAYFFHGHTHSDYGITIKHDMLISNAATTQNLLQI